MKLGADYNNNGDTAFRVWAPNRKKVSVEIVSPVKRTIPMARDRNGYWIATSKDAPPGTEYLYALDGDVQRPDPASNFQSSGPHSPSVVIDHNEFKWSDEAFKSPDISEMIIYELHIGTFTESGTFESVIEKLPDMVDIGVNAIEIMPIAQFPGTRNWGYDGVYPYAPHNSYGGPAGLKTLVDACHDKGIAVILDVVYNHLGPEGNYLWDYGPYFTDKYKTPWGAAVNFDDAHSEGVRNFFIENAIHWFRDYHIDALRLDAIHAIFDMGATHFLKELAVRVDDYRRTSHRKVYLIAESDLNDSRISREWAVGGYGLDTQWSDDFHHALHTLVTGENIGYYVDFGGVEHFIRSIKDGFVYSGQHSEFRKRRHGDYAGDLPGRKFVVFAQNHDQTGNRMFGERLSSLASFEALKLTAAALILSPYVPMLFMGEEYCEDAPFLYFVSHGDERLINAVRKGRKKEFASFGWKKEPPDPQSEDTFNRSRLNWSKRKSGKHAIMLEWYKTVIGLRKSFEASEFMDKSRLDIVGYENEKVALLRHNGERSLLIVLNFSREDRRITDIPYAGRWTKILDSAEEKWRGPGTMQRNNIGENDGLELRAESAAVFEKRD